MELIEGSKSASVNGSPEQDNEVNGIDELKEEFLHSTNGIDGSAFFKEAKTRLSYNDVNSFTF